MNELKAQQARDRERQSAHSSFDRLDVFLAAGKLDRAESLLQQVRKSLTEVDDADLKQRLAASEADLGMLQQLERLFAQRWQLTQQSVIGQIQASERGDVLTQPAAAPHCPGVLAREQVAVSPGLCRGFQQVRTDAGTNPTGGMCSAGAPIAHPERIAEGAESMVPDRTGVAAFA